MKKNTVITTVLLLLSVALFTPACSNRVNEVYVKLISDYGESDSNEVKVYALYSFRGYLAHYIGQPDNLLILTTGDKFELPIYKKGTNLKAKIKGARDCAFGHQAAWSWSNSYIPEVVLIKNSSGGENSGQSFKRYKEVPIYEILEVSVATSEKEAAIQSEKK
jgi:hypothetical protein